MKASKKSVARRKKAEKSSQVTLVNPVSSHFPAFIIGNALVWQVRALVEIREQMEPEAFEALALEFGRYKAGMAFGSSPIVHDALEEFGARYVVQPGSGQGRTLAICGAGPTLRQHAAEYCAQVDDVWGCNSAATWLHHAGHKVTHGFTVDQTEHMAREWEDAPDIEYLVASTVHPELMDVLVGAGRRFRYFHNFVGVNEKPVLLTDTDGQQRSMNYEDWLYTALFPTTVRSGSGLNSVTRAIDIAQFMGYEKIYVLGADCALQYEGAIPNAAPGDPAYIEWLKNKTVMHADGGSALASDATPITLRGEIDGRTWLTKPDMAISAQWLARLVQKAGDRIELVGDTLPNAILNAKTVTRRVTDQKGKILRYETVAVDPHDYTWMPNFQDSEGNLANLPV